MGSRWYRVMGLDPALRHGVLLSAEWVFSPEPRLENYEIIFEWSNKEEISVGRSGTSESLMKLANAIVLSVKNRKGILAIDWDVDAVYQKTPRGQIVRVGYFMGYLTRALQSRGVTSIYMSPQMVRRGLGLPANARKEVVHEAFYSTVKGLPDAVGHRGDIADALLLSFLVARSLLLEDRHVEISTQARLPGI